MRHLAKVLAAAAVIGAMQNTSPAIVPTKDEPELWGTRNERRLAKKRMKKRSGRGSR